MANYPEVPTVVTTDAILSILAIAADDEEELVRRANEMDDARRLALLGNARRLLAWVEDLDPNLKDDQ